MLSDLMRLRKEGVIFSAFTRSGNIMACRSRDAAPLRIASPEAVQQLAESGPVSRLVQERTQVGGVGDAPSHSVSGRELRNGVRDEDPDTAPCFNSSMEVEYRGPSDSSGTPRRVSPSGPGNSAGTPRRWGAPAAADPGSGTARIISLGLCPRDGCADGLPFAAFGGNAAQG